MLDRLAKEPISEIDVLNTIDNNSMHMIVYHTSLIVQYITGRYDNHVTGMLSICIKRTGVQLFVR